MRLLIYNIRYGAGAGYKFHLPIPFSGYLKKTTHNINHIAEFVASTKADIAGLIEVDSGSFRSEKIHQAKMIAEKLGHGFVYESKYAKSSLIQKLPIFSNQGNALITNKLIEGTKFHYSRVGIKRLMIELELKELNIFLVHLSLKYRHRQYQLSDLYTLIKKRKKPLILAGDMNPFWGDNELDLFLGATGMLNANKKNLFTYPSRYPKRQLDFILHTPEIKITHFEVPNVHFSDHLPLVCDFKISS